MSERFRTKRFGLALAAIAAIFAAPQAASAQAKKPAADAASKPYEKEALAKGAKDGPAALTASGVKCTPSAFAFAGQGTTKDPATKKDVKQNVFEVSCQEGLGYGLIETVGGSTQAFDCITLAGAPNSNLRCKLPGNADANAQLQPLVAKTGRTCTISDARSVGATAGGDSFFEVACQGATGFILKTSKTAAPEATDCAATMGSNIECKFTTKEQIEAASRGAATQLMAKSGKQCAVSNSRLVGKLTSGEDLYEVACGASGGYMVRARADGSNVVATECAKAEGMAGGCKLTTVTAESQTKENDTYTRLAKAANFDCNVSKYRFVGIDDKTKSELVELVCSNRPDGGMAMFPANNSRGSVYDCVAAQTLGVACQLNSPSSAYARYTQALVAKGKTTCKVSNARFLGRNQTGGDLIETACSDGQPGWVVELANNSVRQLFTCGQAKASGVACQLPGNTK